MADLTSRLLVKLIDGVSGPANAAATSLRRLMGATDKNAVAARGTMNAVKRDMAIVQRAGQRVSGSLSMPLAMIGAYGAKAAYDFAKVGNSMQAVSGISDDQRQTIENHAKALNKLFPATNAEIMGAAFELGRAGLKFDQIMGGLKGTLELGLAGDLGLAESADIATNILTAMRLPAKTTDQVTSSLERVNDVLAYVATNSNTDVRMMGETFKYVGPIAAAAGLSVEQVGAASMVMARNGIRASEAGVAMRSALVRMVRPTKPMIQALERMNVNVADFVKGGRQIKGADIVGSLMADGVDASAYVAEIDAALADPKLQKSTAAMTAAIAGIVEQSGSAVDKAALSEGIMDALTAAGSDVDFFGFIKALQEKGADVGDIARIFDARQGSRLATLLVGDLGEALDDVQGKAKGATAAMAKMRMKGIVGDVAALTAAFENLFIALGESGVMATMATAIQGISGSLESLATTNPALLEMGTYAAMAIIALAPLGMVLSGLAGVVGLAVGSFGLLASGIALVGGPAALVIGLVALLGAAIARNWSKLGEVGSFYGTAISNAMSSIGSALSSGVTQFTDFGSRIAAAITSGATDLYSVGAQMLNSLWEGLKSKASAIIAWASGIASQIGGAIKGAIPGMGGGGGGGGAAGGGGGSAPPGRSRGGRVSRGNSYVVGERRPEIFTPGQSGYITPRVPGDGGGGGGKAAGGGPVSITLSVSGAGDPQAVADKVMAQLERKVNDLFRGVQADARTGFGY